MNRRSVLGALLTFWMGAGVGLAAAQTAPLAKLPLPPSTIPKPGPKDLCPVCGMLVAKYPNWVATIVYRDGHAHHFDGAKDMFKFWFDPPKYAPGHSRDQMVHVVVTDYYNLQRIDAKKAFYVIGSDVLGPMGHELIPHATREEAEDFLKDHKGRRILTFDQVDRALLDKLDAGRF